MEFGILGPLKATVDGRDLAIPAGQQRTLLAFLLLNANRVVSPDRIVEVLWGDRPPERGTKALAFHVSRLRDALAPGRHPGETAGGLETRPTGYILHVDPDALDADRFERLAREGHDRLHDDPEGAASVLADALALWRGEVLADVAYADFAQATIRALDDRRLDVGEDLLEAQLALGRHGPAVADLERRLTDHPMRERLRGLLMLALYRSGRQAEALRVAGDGRCLLSEELGIDPSPELRQLEARILAQDPVLDLPARARTRARNPYKGLRAFDEADQRDFFGREQLVDHLVQRLVDIAQYDRLLAVVGASGSGKSSLVRAGVIPAVRAGRLPRGPWRIAVVVPGPSPFVDLADALDNDGADPIAGPVGTAARTADLSPILRPGPSADRPVLIVIDQMEQVYSRTDAATRAAFLGALAHEVGDPGTRTVAVLTLRADMLYLPLEDPDLGPLLRTGIELVPPITRPELQRAIERPAEEVGAEVEPGLVAEIVADVEGRPGTLPLLQFALTELFERSDGRRLTRDGYAAIGGALGALGRSAEDAWHRLDRAGREQARQVLLAMVGLTGGTATTVRRSRRELVSLADDTAKVEEVLDHLGRRGLLTFDRDAAARERTVEIAHEALLVHWPRLAGWIEELRDDLSTRQRLADAATEWAAADGAADFLARGAKLQRFQAWRASSALQLTDGERAFLEASGAEARRLAEADAARVARERGLERRARTFWRALAVVLLVSLLATGGLATALFQSSDTAAAEAAVAMARERASASTTSLDRDPMLSLWLAVEAAAATQGRGFVVEEAYDALQWSLQAAAVPYPAGSGSFAVRAAPDGPRGVYLVGPEALIQAATDTLAVHGAGIPTDQQCRVYLHAESCEPPIAPAVGASLAVRTSRGTTPASSLAVTSLAGTRVRILSELPADLSRIVSGLPELGGITVDWQPATGGRLADGTNGTVADIALVAAPSTVHSQAAINRLVNLSGRVAVGAASEAAGAYLAGVADQPGVAAGDDSTQYAVPFAATVDDLLWYPARDLARLGLAPPSTSAALDTLTTSLLAKQQTPWCLGTGDASRPGSAAAAWVERALLADGGPTAYDRWVRGDSPFASAEVRAAFEQLGAAVAVPGHVYGGLQDAMATPEALAGLPMLLPEGPACWLLAGSSSLVAVSPGMAGSGAQAIPFPSAEAPTAVLGSVFQVVMLHDRPEVRRAVEALAGGAMASALGDSLCATGMIPLRAVGIPPGCALAPEATRLWAALRAGTFRVRALELFPAPVAAGFLNDSVFYLIRAASSGGPPDLDGWDWGGDQGWSDVARQASP